MPTLECDASPSHHSILQRMRNSIVFAGIRQSGLSPSERGWCPASCFAAQQQQKQAPFSHRSSSTLTASQHLACNLQCKGQSFSPSPLTLTYLSMAGPQQLLQRHRFGGETCGLLGEKARARAHAAPCAHVSQAQSAGQLLELGLRSKEV